MPSEHRLHPASILFALAGSLRAFALPALVLMVSSLRSSPAAGAGSGGPWWPGRWMNSWLPDSLDLENWQVWLLVFLIPATIAAVVRYLTFRVGYEGGELVIRSGLFFRNGKAKPALTAFRFPFVALRSSKSVYVWGRTPGGIRATAVIERKSGGGWRRVAQLKTNGVGIFSRTLPLKLPASAFMRARISNGKSIAFPLRLPPDLFVNPFGS